MNLSEKERAKSLLRRRPSDEVKMVQYLGRPEEMKAVKIRWAGLYGHRLWIGLGKIIWKGPWKRLSLSTR